MHNFKDKRPCPEAWLLGNCYMLTNHSQYCPIAWSHSVHSIIVQICRPCVVVQFETFLLSGQEKRFKLDHHLGSGPRACGLAPNVCVCQSCSLCSRVCMLQHPLAHRLHAPARILSSSSCTHILLFLHL